MTYDDFLLYAEYSFGLRSVLISQTSWVAFSAVFNFVFLEFLFTVQDFVAIFALLAVFMVRNMMVEYFFQPILLVFEPKLTVFYAVVQRLDELLIILALPCLPDLIIDFFSEFLVKLLLHFNGLVRYVESVMLTDIVIVSQEVVLEDLLAHIAPVLRSILPDML